MPDAIQEVLARINEYRAWSGGPPPPRVAVSPDEYRELLASYGGGITITGGIAITASRGAITVCGVPIHCDHGPYPWGSFPDA